MGDSESTALPATSNGPAFDETTGSIQGAVRTEEIIPIVGAQVGIAGTTILATTDEAGRFTLNFVPAGKALVSVIALGFKSDGRAVEVVAGEVVPSVDFILIQLPSTGPYHVSNIYTVTIPGVLVKAGMECMYGSQYGIYVPPGTPGISNSNVKTCQGGLGSNEVHYGHCGADGDQPEIACDFTNEWQSIFGELQWTPTSAASGRGWSWEVLAPNTTRNPAGSDNMDAGSADQKDLHDWWQMSSVSPMITRIDRATALEGSPSGTPGNHPMTEEDLCGHAEGSNAVDDRYCDWVTRLFAGWCTVGGISGGVAGCEDPGPDFIIDPIGSPVSVYFTVFLRQEAPPGWTALPDQ
ncbi:MAG TPA: carboxypeptidase-like regulatory domain-containing protein [Candidatus Thermoplasmatota archaeon]